MEYVMNKKIVISVATACLISSLSAANMDDIPFAKTYPMDANPQKFEDATPAAKKTVVKSVKKAEKSVKKEATKKAKKVEKTVSNADLAKELKKLKKKLKKVEKKLNAVKQHDAYDNVKFTIDFRNSVDNINYKYNSYKAKVKGKVEDWSGTERSNDALLSSRLYLNMKAQPIDKLTFNGQLGFYGTWGGSHLSHDPSLKDWSESSKSTDIVFRLRQAYFSWKDTFGDDGLPYSFSVGRRWSTDGFLANYRENQADPGSPLAHITNMEVNGAMLKVELEKYLLPGSWMKVVYGRAHTGGIHTLNDVDGYRPYAQDEEDLDENVDFFVFFADIYNDGQYHVRFENATILDTKGARTGTPIAATLPNGKKNKSLDAGTANLTALSMNVNGIGDEISDFLDSTSAFVSVAMTAYDPDSGHQLLGSTEKEEGYSYWLGVVIPDMITDDGKLGFEFNHGSQYWTPMTWAEDTAIGSKIATRGDAYEAYWNFNLFGTKHLSSQLRYTHIQHDYTPNIRCSGWVPPKPVDIEADDIRFFINYSY
jgi:hypothetical protein